MSALPESFRGAAANDPDAQETREWLEALSAEHDDHAWLDAAEFAQRSSLRLLCDAVASALAEY